MASAEYQRAWAKKNPDRIRTYNKNGRRKYRKGIVAAQKSWRKRNPKYNRWHHLQKKYGLSKAEYGRLFKGGCWLCGKPFKRTEIANADHDHVTDKFRGLAHGKCNRAIGNLNDSSEMLYRLARALEEIGRAHV